MGLVAVTTRRTARASRTLRSMDDKQRARLIERYTTAVEVIEDAVANLDDAALDREPADERGGWTARQIVHHLADSEMTSAIRLRRLLCEDNPVIVAYDEAEFARRLRYETRPVRPSLDALRAARETSAQLLALLTEEEWQRAGSHSESGRYSVEDWLRIYAAHGEDHADQIRRAASVASTKQ
jgi:hypothetical protein